MSGLHLLTGIPTNTKEAFIPQGLNDIPAYNQATKAWDPLSQVSVNVYGEDASHNARDLAAQTAAINAQYVNTPGIAVTNGNTSAPVNSGYNPAVSFAGASADQQQKKQTLGE